MAPEEFVAIWNSCENVCEVTKVTGQSHCGAIVKASQLRRKGFSLKTMPTRKPVDIKERFWVMVRKSKGCWEWTGSLNGEYGQISTTRKQGPILAHRLSWEIHFGKIPDGLGVLHKCDNPPCVRPDHLFLGTNADNNDDRDQKGRTVKGSDHASSILTTEAVVYCRRKHWIDGVSQSELAREHGSSRSTIEQAVNGKSWVHIPFDDECLLAMERWKDIHPARRRVLRENEIKSGTQAVAPDNQKDAELW